MFLFSFFFLGRRVCAGGRWVRRLTFSFLSFSLADGRGRYCDLFFLVVHRPVFFMNSPGSRAMVWPGHHHTGFFLLFFSFTASTMIQVRDVFPIFIFPFLLSVGVATVIRVEGVRHPPLFFSRPVHRDMPRFITALPIFFSRTGTHLTTTTEDGHSFFLPLPRRRPPPPFSLSFFPCKLSKQWRRRLLFFFSSPRLQLEPA